MEKGILTNEQEIEWFKEGAALNIIRRDFANSK